MATRLELDFDRFQRNFAEIESELRDVRPQSPPAIIPVSKYLSAADCHRLCAEGVGPLGENRANELLEKSDPSTAPLAARDPSGWHFIGHLQRNKVSKVAPRVALIHSLDNARLAAELDRWLENHPDESHPEVLVQVNTSGEESKGGLSADEARRAIPIWTEEYPRLVIRGLMMMAPQSSPEECRPYFRRTRELRDAICDDLPPEMAARFTELSMGMSNDYRIAAEEGATLVRIGRQLYR